MARKLLGVLAGIILLGLLAASFGFLLEGMRKAQEQAPAAALTPTPTPLAVGKPVSTATPALSPTPSPIPLDATTLRISSEKDLGQFSGYAAWSPDGKYLAFTKFGELLKSPDDKVRHIIHDLWIVGADGANARLLTKNAIEPVWSLDGKKVYFNAFVVPGGDPRQLSRTLETYAINLDGTGRKLLSTANRQQGLIEAEAVHALPGGRIAVLAGGRRMVILDGETGNTIQEIAEVDFGPYTEPKDGALVGVHFSPDGTSVAYVGRDGALRVLDLARHVTSKAGEEVTHLRNVAWSPDSGRLAYVNAKLELWTTKAGGLEPRKISDLTSIAGPLTKDMGAGAASWSPDGGVVFFGYSRNTRVGWDTYVVDASGGAPRLLTGNRAIVAVPRVGTTVALLGYDLQPARLVIATLASGGKQP